MLQRKQTLWLLVAAAAAILSLKLPVETGGQLLVDVNNMNQTVNGLYNLPLTILSVAIAVIALITIFLYKNRKTQGRLAITAFLLSILTLGLYVKAIMELTGGTISLSALIVLLIPVAIFYAIRGIRKDEALMKSLDRLR